MEPTSFWSHIAVGAPGECWPWRLALSTNGYARTQGKAAHRLAYELARGPIPEGMELNHDCHSAAYAAGECAGGPCEHRACCNPSHLTPVTRSENNLLGERGSLLTGKCRNGLHDVAASGAVRPNGKNGTIPRFTCRLCKNARQRRYNRAAAERRA